MPPGADDLSIIYYILNYPIFTIIYLVVVWGLVYYFYKKAEQKEILRYKEKMLEEDNFKRIQWQKRGKKEKKKRSKRRVDE